MLASVALLALVLAFVGATAANAAGTWAAPKSIDAKNTSLQSVSCPSANFCAAVDFVGDVLIYNGSSWSAPKNVEPLVFDSVSCPSATFCMATAGYQALTYNGSSWSSPSTIDSGSEILSVSCPSANFCEAVATDTVLTYNGSSWSSPSVIGSPGDSLQSVSCPSANFCAAVGSPGTVLTYNGSSWSSPADIDGTNFVRSVSCPSANFCAAVDDNGNVLSYNGSSWSLSPKSIDASGQSASVSCPSANFCVDLDGEGNALTYNGSSWSSPADIDGTNFFNSVSCPSANFCDAVDSVGDVLTYTSTATSAPATSILIPSKGATVSGTATTLDASASNATSVEFVLFGGSYGLSGHSVGTATLTYYGWVDTWNTTTVPNGSYVLVSYATGPGGSTASSGVSITVNNASPPTTSVLIPSKGATVSGSTTLDASAANATSVEFVLFGGSYGLSGHSAGTATLTYYGWVDTWNTATVPNGSYVLVSYATGPGGSTASSGVSITVHN